MNHKLIRRSATSYYCTVCHQSWTKPSPAFCPGLHVVKADEWGPLMTKTMLGRFGFKTDADSLPTPQACWRMSQHGARGNREYVMLYDRNECVFKKDTPPKRRRWGLLMEIAVTPYLVQMIERYQEVRGMIRTTPHTSDHSLNTWQHSAAQDLCNTAVCVQTMTDEELQAEGGFILQIPPMNLPKGFMFQQGHPLLLAFARNILNSYRAYFQLGEEPTLEEELQQEFEPLLWTPSGKVPIQQPLFTL